MIFFNRRVSPQAYCAFIVLLTTLPTVRADYYSFLDRLYRAFSKFNIGIPDSAISHADHLNTHVNYLEANSSKWVEAFFNDTLSENEREKEMDEASKGYTDSWYHIVGDYMGVGVQKSCTPSIEAVLSETSEWDKAGQQASTVIMAILPSLLTFGNLYVPRSSEAFGTSFLVGLLSAAFGFGLPVKSISAVPVKQTITISRLSWEALTELEGLGTRDLKKAIPARLSELQKWSGDRDGGISTADACFTGISHAALNWRSRTHWWHLPSLLVAGLQTIILLLAVFPLFMGYGVPQLLFDCTATLTSIYLLLSAVVSSVARALMWESSDHERVHIFALSQLAEKQLRQIANRVPRELSTEVELPPLQAPLLVRPIVSVKRNLTRFWFAITRIKHGATRNQPAPQPLPVGTDDRYWMIPVQFTRVLTARVKWIATNMLTFFLSGFRSHSTAIRWRPLIVLAHLSTTGRDPLKTLFTGIVEGSVLLVLTFFFSAQWAGNLIVTAYSVAYLLIAVSVARGLGLAYIKWSVRSAGLHLVECESVQEIYGSLRVLCSMKHLLVRVNGAWYFEGKRMDTTPAFWDWELRSERGEFDDEKRSSVQSTSTSPVSTPPTGAGPALSTKKDSERVVIAVNHRSTL